MKLQIRLRGDYRVSKLHVLDSASAPMPIFFLTIVPPRTFRMSRKLAERFR